MKNLDKTRWGGVFTRVGCPDARQQCLGALFCLRASGRPEAEPPGCFRIIWIFAACFDSLPFSPILRQFLVQAPREPVNIKMTQLD